MDLIKNHLLAQAERQNIMPVEAAFKRWNEMLTNLGDSYANQDRFLRHYYNAFKADLPHVSRAPLATKANLIRIYEVLVEADGVNFLDQIIQASRYYGRITGVLDDETDLDAAFRRLERIQGAPSYVLLLWLLRKRTELALTEYQLIAITELLTSFFVRRNLTGSPQTYALPGLFTGIISRLAKGEEIDVVETVRAQLAASTVRDDAFRQALLESIYDGNTDVARFVLTTLTEDEMTKESHTDLWRRERTATCGRSSTSSPRRKPSQGMGRHARWPGTSSARAGRACSPPRQSDNQRLQQQSVKQTIRRKDDPNRRPGSTHRFRKRPYHSTPTSSEDHLDGTRHRSPHAESSRKSGRPVQPRKLTSEEGEDVAAWVSH